MHLMIPGRAAKRLNGVFGRLGELCGHVQGVNWVTFPPCFGWEPKGYRIDRRGNSSNDVLRAISGKHYLKPLISIPKIGLR